MSDTDWVTFHPLSCCVTDGFAALTGRTNFCNAHAGFADSIEFLLTVDVSLGASINTPVTELLRVLSKFESVFDLLGSSLSLVLTRYGDIEVRECFMPSGYSLNIFYFSICTYTIT